MGNYCAKEIYNLCAYFPHRQYGESLQTTSLTKLDGTAKGGVVIAIKEELGLPVKWIGVGEGIMDFRPFEADKFVDALFDGDK